VAPRRTPVPPLTKDYLIVGEGKGDAAFVSYLCEARTIDVSDFQIEDAGGSGNFGDYIEGLRLRPNFDRAKGLLVIGDGDDRPEANFTRIRGHLKKGKLPFPNEPLHVARNGPGGLAVAVMMLPYTLAAGPLKGSLETILLTSVEQNNIAIGACIDAYHACVGKGRTRNEEHKFRLRCFLAALFPEDPNISLQFALSPTRNLIDLNHPCFDEVADFFRGFAQLCAPLGGRR